MTEAIEHLLSGHMRAVRAGTRGPMKHAMIGIRAEVTAMERPVAASMSHQRALDSGRGSRKTRVGRVERRLDLID